MRYSAVAALMILTTVFLSGCAQQQKAVLDDRSKNYYGRNGGYGMAAFNSPTVQAATVDSITANDLSPAAGGTFRASTPLNAAQPLAAPAPAAVTWQWPVQGPVTAGFGKQREGIANEGITIAAAQGTAVRAAAGGQVAFVGSGLRDYGNMVILRHANGDMSSYAHAQSITVAKGMTVKQGDTIAYVGQSGRAKTPQLHFALRSGDRAIDPLAKLPSQLAYNQ